MRRFHSLSIALICWLVVGPGMVDAQSSEDYDPSWYDSDAPHVQIDVTADGVYRFSASAVRDALPQGTSLSDISPETIRLIENGQEIPIQIDGATDGTLDESDTITFVGRRNRGKDEHWAYDYSREYDEKAQSSTYYSLYSDTTTYWMTWGDDPGLRYDEGDPTSSSAPSTTEALRDTVHAEQDNLYYFGRPDENGNARYTFSEGYFWNRFSHNDASSLTFTHTLAVGRRTATDTELDLSIRLDGATSTDNPQTSSCHRVEVEARLRQSTGSPDFESLTSVEWTDINRRTLTTSVQQDRIPEDGLELRLTSYNDGFSSDDCADPSAPNRVLLDWIEAAYTRSLDASGDTQRFVAPTSEPYTFSLSGYTGGPVHVYNPIDRRRYDVPVTNGEGTVTDTPSTAPTPYWAVGPGGFRSPAAIRPDEPSNWSASSNAADYLILTTRALRPSAQELAEHRMTEAGGNYSVEIALVQNVFDEFDYGRPTPIAIRRFVRASQEWDRAPQFLAIFGDAQYPIRDGSVASLYPEWSVPSYGYNPSDGWFAMQTDGPEDWSEVLAVGRIPVRSVAQGDLFVEKLERYETAPPDRWQKNMLLLAGGTSRPEQRDLQRWSNWWGEIAADTFATTRSYSGPVHTGADTSRYYKKVNDALDASFQDSLGVDLKRGAGWVNYFGHSAAQTWEIVTDPPSEFDNAGRLPVVSSVGCRTGSFAGGRFEEKSAPSLGEQLVVGSVREDGTTRDGARNGAIAHFGESALGFLRPSAQINDALVRRVFVDTVRVLGEAVRQGKSEVNADRGDDPFYAKHLLQYGLLGDPATQLALPERPDLHVAPNRISITPTTPTLSEDLTVSVQVQNRGLIPSDSVDVRLTWQRPDGTTAERNRRVERFRLQRTIPFSFSLAERALGTNTFRVHVDPSDEYAEANETDNVAEKTQVVFSTGVDLISPSDRGLTPTRQPTLQFSLPRREVDAVPVTLQLDSDPSFDSPDLQETTVQTSTLSQTWTPSRTLRDSTTYYWRGRPDTGEQTQWRQGRFTVRTDLSTEGWLQQDRSFQENDDERLDWSPQTGWTFGTFTRDVQISSEEGGGGFKGAINVDGTQQYERRTLGFGIVVMDGTSGRVKKNESFCTYEVSDGVLNERRCGEGVDGQQAADLMADFLQSVDTGDFVFVRTRHLARSGSANISTRVETLLRTLGGSTDHSDAMVDDSLDYNDLWLMLAKKGTPDRTVEQVGESTNEIVQRSTLPFKYPQGSTTTDRIGPVTAWDSLRWQIQGPSGTAQVDVLAADTNRVLEQVRGRDSTIALDAIDPAQHPYLRLRATLIDSTTRTAPQLKQWNVTYEGVPEIAINPAGLRSTPDTIQKQGDDLSFSLPVSNLGATASDAIYVQYDVTDAENVTTTRAIDTLTALAPGETDTSSARISTAKLPGSNIITVRAKAPPTPERISTNNTVIRNVFVRRDRTSPSLTVLSSGRPLPPTPDPINNLRSQNLPFVSAQPSFDIHLRDDNPNLALPDTSALTVYLKDGLPSQNPTPISDFRRIPYSSDQLNLVSSDTSAKNSIRALFEPELQFQEDSTYTLKVEGSDAQGNEIESYQAAFRVQQEQVIRDVYPYPNPMNTHTTFAFRVEGGRNEMLRDFSLRIYTLSGRLVRELTQQHLETPLSVGWNTLRWNGRDADGDRIATGTYLYRVRVKGEDQTFRGDVEKVTVIR